MDVDVEPAEEILLPGGGPVQQQEVDPVEEAGTGGGGRVVGVTQARLVGAEVVQAGLPQSGPGRQVVLAVRAGVLPAAAGGAVSPVVSAARPVAAARLGSN